MLPDRFDEDGRPIERSRGRGGVREKERGGGGQTEMVERIARDFGDVVDGRKSWRDLLGGLMEGVSGAGGEDGGRRRRRD